jgi:hypothetical protein
MEKAGGGQPYRKDSTGHTVRPVESPPILDEMEKAGGGRPWRKDLTGSTMEPVKSPPTLAEMEKADGARGQGRPRLGGCTVQPPKKPPVKLADLGIGKTQAMADRPRPR